MRTRKTDRLHAQPISPVITSTARRCKPPTTSQLAPQSPTISATPRNFTRSVPFLRKPSRATSPRLTECYSFLDVNFRNGTLSISSPTSDAVRTTVRRRLIYTPTTASITTAIDLSETPRRKKKKDVYDLSSTSAEENKAYRSPDRIVRRVMAAQHAMVRRRQRFPLSQHELQYLELGYKRYNGDFLAILRGFRDHFHPSRTREELTRKWTQLCNRESSLAFKSTKRKCRWKIVKKRA